MAGFAAVVCREHVEAGQLELAHRIVVAELAGRVRDGNPDDLFSGLCHGHDLSAVERSLPRHGALLESVGVPVGGREQLGVRLDPRRVVHVCAARSVVGIGKPYTEALVRHVPIVDWLARFCSLIDGR